MDGVENDVQRGVCGKETVRNSQGSRRNPFVGSAENKAHDYLRQRKNIYYDIPAPSPNQMLDSLKGYLDNISAAATQAVAKGGPLAELSASLVISVDTVAAQQK